MNPPRWSPAMLERIAELDACDHYIVLVVDPQTQESDAHGPYDGLHATDAADRIRRNFDNDGLFDVLVSVCRLHEPAEAKLSAA
jgi:hypothetical protein